MSLMEVSLITDTACMFFDLATFYLILPYIRLLLIGFLLLFGHPVEDLKRVEVLVQGDRAACAKPPVEFKTIVPFWPGLSWPG